MKTNSVHECLDHDLSERKPGFNERYLPCLQTGDAKGNQPPSFLPKTCRLARQKLGMVVFPGLASVIGSYLVPGIILKTFHVYLIPRSPELRDSPRQGWGIRAQEAEWLILPEVSKGWNLDSRPASRPGFYTRLHRPFRSFVSSLDLWLVSLSRRLDTPTFCPMPKHP